MRGQVGYWGCEEGGLCVRFGEEMLRWLDEQAHDRRLSVIVSNERTVILLPDLSGGPVTSMNERRDFHHYWRSTITPGSLVVDYDLIPFALMDVDFKAEEGCLSCELPADHELPWPGLQTDCTTYNSETLALEALQARLNSLVASGQTAFKPQFRMPDRLRRLLPAGAWAECLKTAKTLAGAC